tara:strand:+ start:2025 stop:2465 length:441 start_codon:yes stop_codon:yes gene_type:complete
MTDQKNWDAALIKVWRTSGNMRDAKSLFHALAGKFADDCDPPLLRTPKGYFPNKVGVKVFVAAYLPKINERLWNQTPDKDVLLLRKLESSTYDTATVNMNADRELDAERARLIANRKRVGMSTLEYSNRNNETNWNVVKGSRRRSA